MAYCVYRLDKDTPDITNDQIEYYAKKLFALSCKAKHYLMQKSKPVYKQLKIAVKPYYNDCLDQVCQYGQIKWPNKFRIKDNPFGLATITEEEENESTKLTLKIYLKKYFKI